MAQQGHNKPNILVIWGDDIGQSNLSVFTKGMMGYRTPNIDRIANEGMLFTDYYAEQSCTAGRAAFIMGQSVFRTGLSKVGIAGRGGGHASRRSHDRRAAQAARLRDRPVRQKPPGRPGRAPADDARLRRVLRQPLSPECRGRAGAARLSAGERLSRISRRTSAPRGVLHCWARPNGKQKIENTGPLTKKRMETVRRRIPGRGEGLHHQKRTRASKPFFVWFNTTHMHFRTHAKPEKPGPVGALAIRISRRHDRPRQARRRDA